MHALSYLQTPSSFPNLIRFRVYLSWVLDQNNTIT